MRIRIKEFYIVQAHINLHQGEYPSVITVYVHAKDLECPSIGFLADEICVHLRFDQRIILLTSWIVLNFSSPLTIYFTVIIE